MSSPYNPYMPYKRNGRTESDQTVEGRIRPWLDRLYTAGKGKQPYPFIPHMWSLPLA
ncbi:hypothetical protein F2Q69_00012507 [Brassica cretica]|uniref:Uncharacterized protein n=1 Tax=Brassica cretica TaxID=69181 RepID=A0A8S9QHA6_BRACR|nr:hypothetical protein F2Q69_00012507 [Brassica cretica]